MSMTKARRILAAAASIAALAGAGPMSASVSGAAVAQEAARPPAESREIVIVAPRTLPPAPERNGQTGAAIVTTTVHIPVLYGDLDLARPADADRFLVRLNNVVRDVCLTLDRMQPFNPDPECVDRVLPGAAATARATIAAAAKAARPEK